MIFTFENSRKYFEHRLVGEHFTRDAAMVRCPFHGDRTASLSIKLTDGVWNCHAGCGSGGILDFEKKMFPDGNLDSWWETISKVCGLEPNKRGDRNYGKLIATYDYTDASSKLLFQKLRYEPKNFVQRAPNGKGGWDYRLGASPKPLYRLPDLITARVVLIAEGEKDVENLNSLPWASLANGKPMPPVSATCNFDGAGPGKWKDHYSPYFTGRMAVIFPDNDEQGKSHAKEIAESVSRYAYSVKIIDLPDLKEHGDVTNYLENHSVSDLYSLIKKTPHWNPPERPEEKPFYAVPSQITRNDENIDWIVPGVIHRGGKGLIVAAPKAGKSMIALDLAVALAGQQSWLGFPCLKKRVKVAVVSREDGPGMTKKRIRQFAYARSIPFSELDQWMRFNTHEQKSQFSIENESDMAEIIRWTKKEEIEFVIFDVLNLLHAADENSNTQMTQVMKRFDQIRSETGADIAVIHHDKKDSLTGNKKPRGASAIDSWWEWKVAVSPHPEEEQVKEIYFGSKAARANAPVTIEFREEGEGMFIVPALK